MTTLPTWSVWLVCLGTPLLTFVGVLVAQAISRKGAQELETRSRREETMRNLRWAAELAVKDDERMADLGVAQLAALLESDLLDDSEKGFVEAALDAVYQDPEAEIEQLGEDVDVVQYIVEDNVVITDEVAVDEVSSDTNTEDGEGGHGSESRCVQCSEIRGTGDGEPEHCHGPVRLGFRP
jgi:hypothetical protein